jgi:hypothetical protein
MPVAGEKPDAGAVAANHHPKDLVDPAGQPAIGAGRQGWMKSEAAGGYAATWNATAFLRFLCGSSAHFEEPRL